MPPHSRSHHKRKSGRKTQIFSRVDKIQQTIIARSSIEPETNDTYLGFWQKNKEEQEELFRLAQKTIENRLKRNADPVTGM